MGKIQNLTKGQKVFWDGITQFPFISNFYFTGGTALSAVYLNHRYSEDLDFFTEIPYDFQILSSAVELIGEKLHAKVRSRKTENVSVFFLNTSKEELKIDFVYHPYVSVEKRDIWQGIAVDSLRDIAANKLLTINQRSQIKDFVDLYFILKKYTIWDIIYACEKKYPTHILDPYLVGSDLLKIDEMTEFPRMIKPLSLSTLQKFYRELAVKLGLKGVRK